MTAIGPQGAGYTGVGVTGQDVIVYGNLFVSGIIDPTKIYVAQGSNQILLDSTQTQPTIDITDGTNICQYKIDGINQTQGTNYTIQYVDNTTFKIQGETVYNGGSITLFGDSANPGTSIANINGETITLGCGILNIGGTTNGYAFNGNEFTCTY
jgi:hypothetical protein